MKKLPQHGSIMVAVREPDRSSSGLIRKAAALAKAYQCDVELVHVVSIPYIPSIEGISARRVALEVGEERRRSLHKLAMSAVLRGIKTTAWVVWDYPVADALVRHVLKRRPKMLLAESQRHARLARPFLSNTDWELIRKCPCPLWLSKRAVPKLAGPVIAALDPLHGHAKPAALDAAILRHSLEAASGRAAKVLAFHAYLLPAPPMSIGVVEPLVIGMSESEIKTYGSHVKHELDRLANDYQIPPKNRVLVFGDASLALPQVAKKRGASVVVMGAVSRGALKRVFIGHTAERVLDALNCDVLIVKPRSFKTAVTARR